MTEPRSIRRVVTGHDDRHVAKVILDAPATNAKFPGHGVVSTLIWSSDRTPADIAVGTAVEDMGTRILGTPPPPRGTRFAIIDFPAGAPSRMHRTESLDYVIVMAGAIDMDMDASTVHLKAGDVMVQRGTNHAWVNRSGAPARLAFVLIDAAPIGIGTAVAPSGQS
ncbi:MAG: cupin domain-containing protein [Alphaproteobacteria bacterium]|nr:cupin domain-containing protein [Alphaproteobacteria bacterium]